MKHGFKALLLLCSLCSVLSAIANSAMPGLWSNGNGSEFYPLYYADSPYVGKIKMQQEEILVHLYPGFAVVKGVYLMYNSAGSAINLHTGYPVNGHVSSPEIYKVELSDVYGLRVLVNDTAVPTHKAQGDNAQISTELFGSSNNWHVWQMTYAPQAITKITVYFLVNTQDADLLHGYDRKKGNAFTYILESGRAWKDSIGKGEVNIYLKKGLKLSDIYGVLPKGKVMGNDSFLQYSFTNLEPYDSNNVVIWYKKLADKIDFDAVLADSDKYYSLMDLPYCNPKGLNDIKAADFEVGSSASIMIGLAMMAVIFGPWILLAIVIGLAIWWYVRRRKRRQL